MKALGSWFKDHPYPYVNIEKCVQVMLWLLLKQRVMAEKLNLADLSKAPNAAHCRITSETKQLEIANSSRD